MTYKIKLTILINLVIILRLLKVIFVDDLNDYAGMWFVFVVLFLMLFDIYAYIVFIVLKKRMTKVSLLNIVSYFLLLNVPILILWFFTS